MMQQRMQPYTVSHCVAFNCPVMDVAVAMSFLHASDAALSDRQLPEKWCQERTLKNLCLSMFIKVNKSLYIEHTALYMHIYLVTK